MSYNIVNSHQGTIQVDSALGEGAQFTILLPWNEPKETPASSGQAASSSTQRDGRSILVADPDVSVQEMVATYLKGWHVTICEAWEQVHEALEREHFDVAVLDSNLEGEDFTDTFVKLARDHAAMRIVLTSSQFSSETLSECVREAYSHLLKPYAVENLATALDWDTPVPAGS